MANRGVLAIYLPDGTGIRTFESARKLDIGWFIIFNPPVGQFELPIDGRTATQFFLSMHSEGKMVMGNWKKFSSLRGTDPFLDEMISGCEPLISEIETREEDIFYSADIEELLDFDDYSIVQLVTDWRAIHHFIHTRDSDNLKKILIEMIGWQWNQDRGLSEYDVEQIVARISPNRNYDQTPISYVLCGRAHKEFIYPPIVFGWGTGVVDPSMVKENMFPQLDEIHEKTKIDPVVQEKRKKENAIMEAIRRERRAETEKQKKLEPYRILAGVVFFFVGSNLYGFMRNEISPDWMVDVVCGGLFLLIMSFIFNIGKKVYWKWKARPYMAV